MSPIRTLCQAASCWGSVLLMAVLLPVVVSGQALTPEKLRQIDVQLGNNIADTTRVRLLLAVSAHATAHADRISARDSAIQFAKAAIALSATMGYDSGTYKAYLKEMAVWVKVRDLELAQKHDATAARENRQAVQDRFIVFVQGHGSTDQLGEAYMDAAGLNEWYAEGMPQYDSAAACFRRSGNALRESQALYATASAYLEFQKPKEALPFFHRSITLAELLGGPHLYKTYGYLGNTYTTLGGYNLALKYQLKALKLAEAAGDTTADVAILHIFIGRAYDRLKNYVPARLHTEKAYHMLRHYTATHHHEFFSSASNLANAMTHTNPQESIDFLSRFKEEYKVLIAAVPSRTNMITLRFMLAYMDLHNYATAQIYCNKLMAVADKMPQPFVAYLAIGEFLVKSEQYHAAEKYLAQVEQIARQEKRMFLLPDTYLRWFKVDSAKRDYVAAIKMFKLHKAYSDSVLNDTKAKEIALLEIEYETEKKEQSIALLTKDSELSHHQLAQSRFQNNAILAGLAVAVLISGLLFQQYRTKKKTNAELTRRQQEIETTNGLLQKTILEKEWLLKEVHHRVKNNLQTVVSLLGSQSYALQNSEAASAINDSQNRVHAMSLIHQKLYLTEHRTSVNMAGYLGELTEYLRDSFPTGRMIQFELHIQAIELDVSQAIPIGLILNEAITNAIKYAFPAGVKDNCRVVISMLQDSAHHIQLTMADNGKGLPPDFDGSGNYFGMGLRLMHGLTSEIDGHCKIESNKDTGVSIEITFKASALLP